MTSCAPYPFGHRIVVAATFAQSLRACGGRSATGHAVLDIRMGPIYLLFRMTLTPTTRGIHACPSDSICIR